MPTQLCSGLTLKALIEGRYNSVSQQVDRLDGSELETEAGDDVQNGDQLVNREGN